MLDSKGVWVCDECNFPNWTDSVTEIEINSGVLGCINCGCIDFHFREKVNQQNHRNE